MQLKRLKLFLTKSIAGDDAIALLPTISSYCMGTVNQILRSIDIDKPLSWTLWFFWNFLEIIFALFSDQEVSQSPVTLRL